MGLGLALAYAGDTAAGVREAQTGVAMLPIAKDGFELPASQANLRPSIVDVPSGETADFEFTPDRSGDVVLEVFASPAANASPQAQLRFRVASPSR